jgi:hypothetical protein
VDLLEVVVVLLFSVVLSSLSPFILELRLPDVLPDLLSVISAEFVLLVVLLEDCVYEVAAINNIANIMVIFFMICEFLYT